MRRWFVLQQARCLLPWNTSTDFLLFLRVHRSSCWGALLALTAIANSVAPELAFDGGSVQGIDHVLADSFKAQDAFTFVIFKKVFCIGL